MKWLGLSDPNHLIPGLKQTPTLPENRIYGVKSGPWTIANSSNRLHLLRESQPSIVSESKRHPMQWQFSCRVMLGQKAKASRKWLAISFRMFSPHDGQSQEGSNALLLSVKWRLGPIRLGWVEDEVLDRLQERLDRREDLTDTPA